MAWFAELAGKAENLLINLDEQTGAALRNHNTLKQKKHDRHEFPAHAEPPWSQKKRPIPRALKAVPTRKPSPTAQSSMHAKESHIQNRPVRQKSPTRKVYNLNNCPRTLVQGDIQETDMLDSYGYKPRRFSLPEDLDHLSADCLTYRMENLEVENAMLKNELNVTNREIKELLERLHRTEDGEPVDDSSTEELSNTNKKLENAEIVNRKTNVDKETLSSQLEQLKTQIANITTVELYKYKELKRELESEISVLRERNKELEEVVKHLNERSKEKDTNCSKVENDLRHAHSTINVLQNDLDKSNGECRRLEKEWESYKHRVKSMLAAKDKEIKALQQGVNFTEDTKVLVEQIEHLKEEREVLSEAVTRVRGECGDMKQYMDSLESRHNAAERVVVALRDALKDERAARTRAEAHSTSLAKELKSIEIDMGQTIASLRTALRDKEQELTRVKESTTSTNRSSSDSSGLNVADYDVSQDSEDSERVYLLTQKLVQKQGKIDMLMADNNMLKIQLDKLECKHRSELQALRGNTHSVVHLQDGDRNRTRAPVSTSVTEKVSRWLGVLTRRYPIFRVFIVIYMVCLHFWVLTVLFTSTPENFSHRTVYRPVLNPQI